MESVRHKRQGWARSQKHHIRLGPGSLRDSGLKGPVGRQVRTPLFSGKDKTRCILSKDLAEMLCGCGSDLQCSCRHSLEPPAEKRTVVADVLCSTKTPRIIRPLLRS